jgi:hypothetical protein
MTTKKKLPIILTLEIVQEPAPNDRWYEVTGVLSWENVYHHLSLYAK